MAPRNLVLIIAIPAALAAGTGYGLFMDSEPPVEILEGRVLSVQDLAMPVPQISPTVKPYELTGYVQKINYVLSSETKAAGEATSFVMVANNKPQTIHILNPGPEITAKLQEAKDKRCPVRVTVINIGAQKYLYGGASSIKLLC